MIYASRAYYSTAVGLLAAAFLINGTSGGSDPGEVPTVKIYRHSAWEATPPKGVDADGIRRNLAPNDSVTFKGLTITVTAMTPAAAEGEEGPSVDQVTFTLTHADENETVTIDEGKAFNWNGFHIAIVAIYARRGELGFGSTVFEVATIESLPAGFADGTEAGGPERRLRVPHTIDKLTLHHSATSHVAGDDLAQKMRNMQAWGERDRNWWDIPYHFIIDLDGTVLEARDYNFVGDTNTRYNPSGHFLINCFGNYNEDVEPNEAQLATIANLMAWATVEFDIDPLLIYGHRDLASTGCPGDNLYRYIADGSLKRMVEDVLEIGQPELVWLDEMEGR